MVFPKENKRKPSVVVLSFNHPELTARSVSSAMEFEDSLGSIFIVHNGSLEQHVRTLKERFPKVTHLVLEKNRMYSGGVNYGLGEAFKESEWVILLTNDTILENVPVLPFQPCLQGPAIFRRKSNKADSFGGLFVPAKAKLLHFRSFGDFLKNRHKGIPYIPGTAFLVHREIFFGTEGLDESLGIYWDDVDWSARVLKQGFSLVVEPDWKVRHFMGKTCHSNSFYTLYLFQRNRKRVSLKWATFRQRPGILAILFKDWVGLAFRKIKQRRQKDLRLLWRAVAD